MSVLFPSLQLGTGKTAGWLVGWLLVGWLVSHVCVCPLCVWPYLRNGSSDQLRFDVRQRAARPENLSRPACVSQARRASAECIMLYVFTVYPAVSWPPRGRAHEYRAMHVVQSAVLLS